MKRTVLIVEDERAILELLANQLQDKNITVLSAKDGKEGLSLALKEHPDLILLDLIMPQMDGITMLKKLRSDTWGSTVPAIILTNLINNSSKLAAEIYNAVGFIVKTDLKLANFVPEVKKKMAVAQKSHRATRAVKP